MTAFCPDNIFDRTERLVGREGMKRLSNAKIIIFGIGGVGSWAAEALVRTGVGHLTLVDADTVATTNINRQLEATTLTVGEPKTEALARRLREINPAVSLATEQKRFTAENAAEFHIGEYDYVIDAIDSLDCKALLICEATATKGVTLYSSMGAALKLSASKISTAEFWKVEGCPLARALRQKFKRSGIVPSRKFKCVYSPETLHNRSTQPIPASPSADDNWSARKAVINGTFAHTTAIFGLTLAGLLIEDIYNSSL